MSRAFFGFTVFFLAVFASLVLAQSAPLSISTDSVLPPATVGKPFSVQFNALGGVPPFKWSVEGALFDEDSKTFLALAQPFNPASGTSFGLPPGTSFSLAGLFKSTPSQSGGFHFRATVTDSKGNSAQKTFFIAVFQSRKDLVIVGPRVLPLARVGEPFSHTFSASGASAYAKWELSSTPPLPAGVSFESSLEGKGLFKFTPSSPGAFLLQVVVKDGGRLAQEQVTLVALPPSSNLVITTPQVLPNAFTGAAYSTPLAAAGAGEGAVWSLAGGVLPPGFTPFVSALPGVSNTLVSTKPDGAVDLAGTPTAVGAYFFSLAVADKGRVALESFVLPVLDSQHRFSIKPDSPLPDAIQGKPYRKGRGVAFTVSPPILGGGSWSVGGVGIDSSNQCGTGSDSSGLPIGLCFDAAKGTLKGTPLGAGKFSFDIRFTSTSGSPIVKGFSLTVKPTKADFTITTTSLPAGKQELAYGAAGGQPPTPVVLKATGAVGKVVWLLGGSEDGQRSELPAGMCLVSGIKSSDATSPCGDVSGLPAGTLTGTPRQSQRGRTSADSPFTLFLEANDVVLSPDGSVLQVLAAASATLELQVQPPNALAITTQTLLAARQCTSYSATFKSSGGVAPLMWLVKEGTLLPVGLVLSTVNPSGGSGDRATALLSSTKPDGTPGPLTLAPGSYKIGVQVSDSQSPALTASQSLTLAVAAAHPIRVSSNPAPASGNALKTARVGEAYNLQFTASGSEERAVKWSVSGNLPNGLCLVTGNAAQPVVPASCSTSSSPPGSLSGTPTARGTSSFEVVATPECGQPARSSFRLKIQPAGFTPADGGWAWASRALCSWGLGSCDEEE